MIRRETQMKRDRKKGDAAKLEMTPMIDVVFQLLIFFIVTLQTEDLLSRQEVYRPAPDSQVKPQEQLDLVTIVISTTRYNPTGISLNGQPVRLATLDKQLAKIASFSKTTSILIKCTNQSPHSTLVKALDICAKNGLTRLNVFTIGDEAGAK